MDMRKFANFLMIVGLMFAIGGFFTRSITMEKIQPLESEAAAARARNPDTLLGTAPTAAMWKLVHLSEYFMWGGGGLLLLGFGIAWARKEDQDDPGHGPTD